MRALVIACALVSGTAYADDERWSTGVEIIPLFLTTLDVHVEYRVHPQIGVALLTGAGWTTSVVVGDRAHRIANASDETARWKSFRIGGAMNLYAQPFSGAHFGIEIVHYRYGAPDPEPDFDSVSVLDAGGYFGWKWLEGRWTAVFQIGAKYFHSDLSTRADNVSAHGNIAVGVSW